MLPSACTSPPAPPSIVPLRWTGGTEAHPFADVKVMKPDERRAHERRVAFTEGEVGQPLAKAKPVDAWLLLLGGRGGR